MPEPTQAVDPQASAQAANTDPNTTAATPGASTATSGTADPQTGAAAKVADLPEWAQKEISSLRKEAADRRKAASEAEATAKAADEANLARNAQWQELATKRGQELDALQPRAILADKLTEVVTAQYAAEIKDWPAEVKAMAPDDGADILTKLAWMSKAKPLATELLKDKPAIAGNGSRPKVAGASGSKPAPITPITDVRRNF